MVINDTHKQENKQTVTIFSVSIPSLDLHLSLSISVTFPNKQPLFIALGRTLVLEAQFQLQPDERILLRTWELKNDAGEVRVAEDLTGNNNRTTVEKNGALLRIREFKDGDFGIYKITVTTLTGDQVSDSREVIKICKWL